MLSCDECHQKRTNVKTELELHNTIDDVSRTVLLNLLVAPTRELDGDKMSVCEMRQLNPFHRVE